MSSVPITPQLSGDDDYVEALIYGGESQTRSVSLQLASGQSPTSSPIRRGLQACPDFDGDTRFLSTWRLPTFGSQRQVLVHLDPDHRVAKDVMVNDLRRQLEGVQATLQEMGVETRQRLDQLTRRVDVSEGRYKQEFVRHRRLVTYGIYKLLGVTFFPEKYQLRPARDGDPDLKRELLQAATSGNWGSGHQDGWQVLTLPTMHQFLDDIIPNARHTLAHPELDTRRLLADAFELVRLSNADDPTTSTDGVALRYLLYILGPLKAGEIVGELLADRSGELPVPSSQWLEADRVIPQAGSLSSVLGDRRRQLLVHFFSSRLFTLTSTMPDITVKLRHPTGTTTLSLDPSQLTVHDLRRLIFSACDIPPEEQEIKYSYPPKPLPASSASQHLSSIPITKGEQLIVTAVKPSPAASTPSAFGGGNTPAPSVKHLNESLSAPNRLTPASQIGSAAGSPYATTGNGPSRNAKSGGEGGSMAVLLPGDAGTLELRKVPDDNACLFSAVGVVFEGGIEGANGLRKIVVDAIRKDPDTYSEVVLGKPVEEYIQAISKPDTWGGAIELSIFSTHYRTEISSFDVQTGRVDRFGEGQYENRCVLVYSGIHYDALSLSPVPDAPASFHTTVFPVHDDSVLDAAGQLVQKLKGQHYYTDTATFDLRCGVCGEGLKGEKGAREHAMTTGHVEFGEY